MPDDKSTASSPTKASVTTAPGSSTGSGASEAPADPPKPKAGSKGAPGATSDVDAQRVLAEMELAKQNDDADGVKAATKQLKDMGYDV